MHWFCASVAVADDAIGLWNIFVRFHSRSMKMLVFDDDVVVVVASLVDPWLQLFWWNVVSDSVDGGDCNLCMFCLQYSEFNIIYGKRLLYKKCMCQL